MKPIQIALRTAGALCLAVFLSSASCELFDKVDDVTFEIVLEHPFVIDEKFDSKGKEVAYTSKQTVDAAAISADFAKYKDKIKTITVNSVTYQVSDYAAGGKVVIFKNGKSGFSATNGTAGALVSLAIENIQASQGSEKPLTIDQAGLNSLSDLLKNDKKADIHVQGAFSETSVAFKVVFKVKATVVANAL